MKTTLATAWHPPWVALWRGWGLPADLRAARMKNKNSKIVIKRNKPPKIMNKQMRTTLATARHPLWQFCGGPGELPVALCVARLGHDKSRLRNKTKQRNTNNHMKTTPAAVRHPPRVVL